MDHQRAMRRLRDPSVLQKAFEYAIYDRTHADFFFDFFEIEYAVSHRDELISELIEELREPARFSQRPAFAYFPPKNDLCDRRLIYIPIKDLTLRYAFGILLSEHIETDIHPQCFANRRASGSDENVRFTENFATGGWARFCAWQAQCAATNNVLLRTDISSFYDSISHEYLIAAVCRHLGLPVESDFVLLLRRVLQIPVIYYSPSTGQIEGPTVTHHGVPLGDGVEGYLANIYLKDVDDAMAGASACYGRYVDDIRLFATSRQDVLADLRVLQEQLLRKGLNLNASKTKIAENEEARAELVSRLYFDESYNGEDDVQAGRRIAAEIDPPLSEFTRTFGREDAFTSGSDAKAFCRYLSAHRADGTPIIPLDQRRRWHVDRLHEIIAQWRGPTKHACWLLVQTAMYRGVTPECRQRAREVMLILLENDAASAYGRYRILHHLVKLRRIDGVPRRFIDDLSKTDQKRIEQLIPRFLSAHAFELNLISLYAARVLGSDIAGLRYLVEQHCNSGCEPVRNTLQSLQPGTLSSLVPDIAETEIEADEELEPFS
jgi:hypothetical protein